MINHEQSRVLHEALSAVGAQSTYVLIAGAGHEGPEFVAPRSPQQWSASWRRSSARKSRRNPKPGLPWRTSTAAKYSNHRADHRCLARVPHAQRA
jgi:hypothetical protein